MGGDARNVFRRHGDAGRRAHLGHRSGFQGWDRVVYAYLLAAPNELALIETGPTSTLPALYAGIEAAGFDPAQLTKIFVSHIHLDHSGGAGAIVRQQPDVQVFVHPIGTPHLIDPSRLVSSAGRLYGDRMDALWGEVVPVPEDRVIPLTDGETQEAAGHVLSVLFLPGTLPITSPTGNRSWVRSSLAMWAGCACPALTMSSPGAATGSGARRLGDLDRPPAPSGSAPPLPDPRRALRRRLRASRASLMPNLAEVEEICRAAMLGGADDEAVTDLLQTHTERRIGAVATEDAGIVQRYGWASPSVLSALGFRRLLSRRGDIPRQDRPAS